jgi:hypothetical protein
VHEQRNDYTKDWTAGKKDIKRGIGSVTDDPISGQLTASLPPMIVVSISVS